MIRISRRAALAFSIGFLTGMSWLLPVFGPPNDMPISRGDVSIVRILRFVVPLLVFALVRPGRFRRAALDLFVRVPLGVVPRWVLRVAGAALVLVAIPVAGGIVTMDPGFLLTVVLPIPFSVVVLLGIAMLDDDSLRNWVLGIGFAATLLVLAGLIASRGEMTSYFGRPRMVLYLSHPINTGAALLASLGFGVISLAIRARGWPVAFGRVAWAALTASYGALLYLAQSRNTVVTVACGVLVAWLALRTTRRTRTWLYVIIVFLPLTLYAYAVYGSVDDPLWHALDQLSSFRLQAFRAVATVSMTGPIFGFGLLGPGAWKLFLMNQAVGQARGGFGTDSVFLNMLLHFGLLSFVSFVWWVLAVGLRLARRRETAIAFGAICATVINFSLDGGGLVVSNLAIFVVFAYAVRAALWSEPAPTAA